MPTLKETLQNVLNQAATNPDAFVDGLKMFGKKIEDTAEQVYDRIKNNPKLIEKGARNAVIQAAAKKLQRELGFDLDEDPKPQEPKKEENEK